MNNVLGLPAPLQQLFSLDYWLSLFTGYRALGPLAPALLSALESFIPPLPLIAIVTLNVASYGPAAGFFYSWIGTCAGCTVVFLFVRHVLGRAAARGSKRSPALRRAREWVPSIGTASLFIILMMPFTPSSLMNLLFGLSEYPASKYLLTLALAKLVMIGSLALFGESAVRAAEDPRFIVLTVCLAGLLYFLSRWARKKHGL